MSLLIYGANGYVGRLLVERACGAGLPVVAAGRSDSVTEFASSFGVETRVGPTEALHLAGVALVLNAAGPFSATARPLAARCIDHGASYVDIAGEAAEFEAVRMLDAAARDAGSVLMPGVGFGVVPTDCLAAHLVARLPDADRLEIAFHTDGGVSGGTLRSMVAAFGDRGAVADRGELGIRQVSFPAGAGDGDTVVRRYVQNPWRGDLVTAPASTGVATVTTWISVPRPVEFAMVRAHRRGDQANPPASTKVLRAVAAHVPAGPSAEKLKAGRAAIWACASNPSGETIEATLTTPDAYLHTADAAIAVAAALLDGVADAGFRTPAQQFGPDFVLQLPDIVRTDR